MIVTREMMTAAKGYVQRAWGQGDENVLAENPTCYCVGTACAAAAGTVEGLATNMVLLFKDANDIPKLMPIADWNDAPERTKAEVLAAFDKAIERSGDMAFAYTADQKERRNNRAKQKAMAKALKEGEPQ